MYNWQTFYCFDWTPKIIWPKFDPQNICFEKKSGGEVTEGWKSTQTHNLEHFPSWRLLWPSYILILIYPGGLKNAFRNISRPHLAGQLTLRPQVEIFIENDFVPISLEFFLSISVCAHWAISWGHMILISKKAQKVSTNSGKASGVFFKAQTHNLEHFPSWRLPWLSYILILIYPGGLKNAFRNISRPHLAGQLTLRPLSGNFYRKWLYVLLTFK